MILNFNRPKPQISTKPNTTLKSRLHYHEHMQHTTDRSNRSNILHIIQKTQNYHNNNQHTSKSQIHEMMINKAYNKSDSN